MAAKAKTLERVYNIPLRKQVMKSPKYKRSKKAVNTVKEFVAKHMKVDLENVRIGQQLNLKIWENGIKNPPHHVKVGVKTETEDNKNIAKVELEGIEFKTLKVQDKKATPAGGLKGKLDQLKDSMTTKEGESLEEMADKEKPKAESKPVEKTEAKKEEPKVEEKKTEAKPVEKKAEDKKEEPKKETVEKKDTKEQSEKPKEGAN